MVDRPSKEPEDIAFLLAQVGGLAALRFAEHVAPLRLTPPHASLLQAVAKAPGRSQQALAVELGLLPSRLVALLDELEHAGLLERRRNPDDRRHHALHPTPRGLQRLTEVAAVARHSGRELLEPLTPRDRASLARILEQLADRHGLTPGVHPGFRTLGRSGCGLSEDPVSPADPPGPGPR